MKFVAPVLIVLVAFGLIGLIVMYSGAIDVSTNNHDNALINWVLDTGMTRSVQRHAKGISVPSLSDSAMIAAGFREFHQRCKGCHGAPGVQPGGIAKGLWPEPPDLAKSAGDWKPAELYWVIKNGIKSTGMPAFGRSENDSALWAMTAFLQKLPKISAPEYKAMMEKAGVESPKAGR